jgi:hypothetical protein
MQRVQSVVQMIEGGMELEGLTVWGQDQKPERASSTVAK